MSFCILRLLGIIEAQPGVMTMVILWINVKTGRNKVVAKEYGDP